MLQKFKNSYVPFAVALRDVIDRNLTTVEECCIVAEVSDQSIRNWRNEERSVPEDKAHALASKHPSAEVRRILTQARCSGAEFLAVAQDSMKTDLDGDGRTTPRDLLLSLASLSGKVSDEIRALASEDLKPEVAAAMSQRLQSLLNETTRAMLILTKAVPSSVIAKIG